MYQKLLRTTQTSGILQSEHTKFATAKQKQLMSLKYRKKTRISLGKIREEVQPQLEKHIEPLPVVAEMPEIRPKVGKPPRVLKEWASDPKVQLLLKYIKEGLSPKEAGILAGWSPEEMDDLANRSDPFRRFVQKALIEFKQTHLEVISKRADPKMSQWLLEKMFPEEFSPKARDTGGSGAGSSTTVIQAIVKTIQSTPDEPVPVSYTYASTPRAKEEPHDGAPQDDSRAEPSLDSGGANII